MANEQDSLDEFGWQKTPAFGANGIAAVWRLPVETVVGRQFLAVKRNGGFWQFRYEDGHESVIEDWQGEYGTRVDACQAAIILMEKRFELNEDDRPTSP